MVKIKSISIALTSRALKNANPDSAKAMTCHILYVLEKWFKQKYEIDVSYSYIMGRKQPHLIYFILQHLIT